MANCCLQIRILVEDHAVWEKLVHPSIQQSMWPAVEKKKDNYFSMQQRKEHLQCKSFRVPRLHKLIRNLLKPKSTHIPDLQGPNDEVLTTVEGKANALNNFFVSQSRKTSAEEGDPPDIRTAQASTSITKFTTSVAKVAKLLSRIDTSKSTSPDGITARVLRLASDELAPYINKVFELSFETGELPRTWKDAVVTPVYKKGDRSNPGNYRPISLLSATSKVLEKIVCEQLGEQVERHYRKSNQAFVRLTARFHNSPDYYTPCTRLWTMARSRTYSQCSTTYLRHLTGSGIGAFLQRWNI